MTKVDDILKVEDDGASSAPDFEIQHVYPLEGIAEHDIESTHCSCGPYLQFHKDVILVIHRTWDRSEKVEFLRYVHGEVIL